MNALSQIGRICFILIPFTLCFRERANTAVLFLYGACVLLQPGLPGRFRRALGQRWLLPFLLLYGLIALSLFWSVDLERGSFILEKKAGLVALPLLLAMDEGLSRRRAWEAMLSLVAGCVFALWISLGYAAWQYSLYGDPSVFFYHRLGWLHDELNAVYFSFYLLLAIVFFDYLIRENAFSFLSLAWLRVLAWTTLAGGLILLSSRLFIVLGLFFGLVRLGSGWQWKSATLTGVRRWGGLVFLLGFGLLAFLASRERFEELAHSHFEVLRQEEFRWDTPFNGLTLRLLLLKFGWQALGEQGAFFSGLGVGDVRQAVNNLALRYGLYHGNLSLGDTGYLNYSLHNQYMESWLQAGLPALLAWLWLLAYGLGRGLKAGWRFPLLWLAVAVIALSFFESVMERQRGLVFIVFFLSALYLSFNDENTKVLPGARPA